MFTSNFVVKWRTFRLDFPAAKLSAFRSIFFGVCGTRSSASLPRNRLRFPGLDPGKPPVFSGQEWAQTVLDYTSQKILCFISASKCFGLQKNPTKKSLNYHRYGIFRVINFRFEILPTKSRTLWLDFSKSNNLRRYEGKDFRGKSARFVRRPHSFLTPSGGSKFLRGLGPS